MSSRSVLAVFTLLSACSSADMGGLSQDLGVSPGGAEDLGYVRDLIEAGSIPNSASWSAEGLFSEHDLPLSGETCTALLCPRAAAATLPQDPAMLVQLGFGTRLDEESWQRAPLNLAVAVDVSGSMDGEKLESTQVALLAMVDQLDAADRLTLISFNEEASLRMESVVMDPDGQQRAREAISRLRAGGATSIEAGLELAFEQVLPQVSDALAIEDRVLLFTDAQPNVGDTSAKSFAGLTETYADLGIGLTVFGVGLDLGAELAQVMGEVRGGNYVYLPDAAHIATVFDEAFDLLVSPIAYDLEVRVRAAEGWRFVDAVGAPLFEDSPEISFGASTLFLSHNDGGMAVLMAPVAGGASAEALLAAEGPLASFDRSYEDAQTGDLASAELGVAFAGGDAWSNQELGAESPRADDLGVYKMAFLLDEVSALRAASAFCDGTLRQDDAIAQVAEARQRLLRAAAQLDDHGLQAEAELMGALAQNLVVGSSRCQP